MKKFKKLYVEITNSCNMSCSFCPGTVRDEGFMGRELFEKIMKETQSRALYTYFHVMGEPLMHPDISVFLDIAAEYGHRVTITTNGTLTSRLEYLLSKEALRNINFSLHSIEDSAGENETLHEIFSVTKKAMKTERVSVSFRLWNLRGKGTENSAVLKKIEDTFCPGTTLPDVNTAVNGIRIAERLFVNIAEEFRWPSLSDPEITGPANCKGLRQQAAILCDGTVTACCLDKDGIINLGNITQDSFESIIESPRAKTIRENFGKRKCNENLCVRCNYRLRFTEKHYRKEV